MLRDEPHQRASTATPAAVQKVQTLSGSALHSVCTLPFAASYGQESKAQAWYKSSKHMTLPGVHALNCERHHDMAYDSIHLSRT
eukprot:1146910-Pelagomonas_calceolata.AAC.4